MCARLSLVLQNVRERCVPGLPRVDQPVLPFPNSRDRGFNLMLLLPLNLWNSLWKACKLEVIRGLFRRTKRYLGCVGGGPAASGAPCGQVFTGCQVLLEAGSSFSSSVLEHFQGGAKHLLRLSWVGETSQ